MVFENNFPTLADIFREPSLDRLVQDFEVRKGLSRKVQEDGILYTANFAGIPKENIEVTVQDNWMHLKGNFEDKERTFDYNYKVNLPRNIKDKHILPTYNNGMLEVLIKTDDLGDDYKARKIEIK